jgi:hypothetical protein
MSDANSTSLYAVKETLWGETPDGSATLKEIPSTGSSVAIAKVVAESTTIKSNRTGRKSRSVGRDVSGDTNHELTGTDFREMLGAALSDDAGVLIDINAEACTTDASAGTITADAGTPFTALAAASPSFLRIAGGLQAGTNGAKKVVSITSSVITLAAGELTTDETAVDLDIDSHTWQNGSDDISWLVERQHADTGHKFWFNGMIVGSATLSLDTRSIFGLSFSWVGKDGEVGISSTATGYLTNVITALGASAVTIDTGTRALKAGQKLTIAGDATTYTLTADYVGGTGSIAITPVLVEATTDGAVLTLTPDDQVSAGDGTPTADDGSDSMNTSSDVRGIWLDDTLSTECFSGLSLTLDNAQRLKPCIASTTTALPGKNRYRVTGSVSLHFTDMTEYRAFLAHDSKKLQLGLVDPDDNFIGITIPSLTFDSSAGPSPSGEDTDIILPLEFTAFENPAVAGQMVVFDFLPA